MTIFGLQTNDKKQAVIQCSLCDNMYVFLYEEGGDFGKLFVNLMSVLLNDGWEINHNKFVCWAHNDPKEKEME